MNKLLLSLALAMGGAAVPCLATVIIADPFLPGGSYTHVQVSSFSSGATGSSTSLASGGNTGPFRSTTISTNSGAASGGDFFNFNTVAIWDPSTQGALNTVAFALDIRGAGMTFPTSGLSLTFGVRQNGINYFNPSFNTVTTSWTNAVRASLTQANFGSGFFTGAPQPDFSASGAPIQFGYYLSGVSVPGPVTFTGLADNFCVIGNGGLSECGPALTTAGNNLPEPASFAMLGGALVVLGVIRRRRSH